MKSLLFLSHRVPYPPNKGDKIRSFNLLKGLSRHYRIHLGAFVDDPKDWTSSGALQEYCAGVCLRPLGKMTTMIRAAKAMASGQPATVPCYRDQVMAGWVRDVVEREGIDTAFIFSSAMAQYVMPFGQGMRRVVDFVDVDSDKWQQYGERKRWPLSYVYRREAAYLRAYERRVAEAVDASVFVSDAECELFERHAPEAGDRIVSVENGVDVRYFDPHRSYKSPYAAGDAPIVFTGAMDYWANVDAVCWFVREILPAVRERVPGAVFYIVGARPTPAVEALGKQPGVRVTRAVHDVRPYLAHARVAVAPLRVARGVQNKVLEAMAMAKPVVATSSALSGLGLAGGYPHQADEAGAFARQVASVLLDAQGDAFGETLRQRVVSRYDWDSRLERLLRILAGQESATGEPLGGPRLTGSG